MIALNGKKVASLITHQFEAWVEEFCHSFHLTTGGIYLGADRCQLNFSYQQHTYVLFAEILCEALWIEALDQSGANKLRDLYEYLSKDTLVHHRDM